MVARKLGILKAVNTQPDTLHEIKLYMDSAQPPASLVTEEQIAIRLLLDKLLELYADEVQQVLFFGSKARGDFNTDSDTDLLVLVNTETWDLRRSIWSLAAQVELNYDVIFNVQVIGVDRWQQMCLEKFSLCRNVERDGITLFSRSK